MRLQLDKARAQKVRLKELKSVLRTMRSSEARLLDQMADLRRKLNPERRVAEIQTDDYGMS